MKILSWLLMLGMKTCGTRPCWKFLCFFSLQSNCPKEVLIVYCRRRVFWTMLQHWGSMRCIWCLIGEIQVFVRPFISLVLSLHVSPLAPHYLEPLQLYLSNKHSHSYQTLVSNLAHSFSIDIPISIQMCVLSFEFYVMDLEGGISQI
jgi:hypothetical protein